MFESVLTYDVALEKKWGKQGDLKLQLIIDLLSVAREKGFKSNFNQNLSQAEGHGGLGRVSRQDRTRRQCPHRPGRERTGNRPHEGRREMSQDVTASPERGSLHPGSCFVCALL